MTTDPLASGTYEILRNRLRNSAGDLRARLERLHQERASVFGNVEFKLHSTAHITTENNCIPRDLFPVGNHLILGYNVQFGLKTDVTPKDVFSVYEFDGQRIAERGFDLLEDQQFQRDFVDVYRYYKQTSFSRFLQKGPLVYFVFQVGKTVADIKAFKWAIDGDRLRYIDNRSDAEVRFPNQHSFQWQRTTRDQHRFGKHPHISIRDIVFVECIGGDLTVKIEDNTEDGLGIYREPVENPDQTLDDAEIYWCIVGNLVLLKIRPYQEKDFRHLVYSTKRRDVVRLDGIAQSCILLPGDHGILFPNGYYLQTGVWKLFDHGLTDLMYLQTVTSPNGEDSMYVFLQPEQGAYLQLRYNLIRQEVDTPMICHGYATYDDGTMITMKSQDVAQKHHALQLWQTPFYTSGKKIAVQTESMLYKIGNQELVRGMAECREVLQLIDKEDSYQGLYVDLVKRTSDILDGYFWIAREETQQLSLPLIAIRDAAAAAVEEYEKVVRVREQATAALKSATQQTDECLGKIERSRLESIADFIGYLGQLRTLRGVIISLRDMRSMDIPATEVLEKRAVEATNRLGMRCTQFLLGDQALVPYRERLTAAAAKLVEVTTGTIGKTQAEELDKIGAELELLIETISQLPIEDVTVRTKIIDRCSELLSDLNRLRSELKVKVRELMQGEMEADFHSQSRLLDQAVASAIEAADTPERVDDAITRLTLQMEELESRFAEFDWLLPRLAEKRESVLEALENRRQALVEIRSRRAESLVVAAKRIIAGIQSRAGRMETVDQLHAFFAADAMVAKVRSIVTQLEGLGDTVRMDDCLSRLRTVMDDSVRQLQDRRELFAPGGKTIRLGKHTFTTHDSPVELTTVVRDETLQVHLTGTQFHQPILDETVQQARDLWMVELPSETSSVYRAEYLAYTLEQSMLVQATKETTALGPEKYLKLNDDAKLEWVRNQMQARHREGYARGIHDADGTKILSALIEMRQTLGLLIYEPSLRARAWWTWTQFVDPAQRESLETWVRGFSMMEQILPALQAAKKYQETIADAISSHMKSLLQPREIAIAAEYIFHQLRTDARLPIASRESVAIVHDLKRGLADASWHVLKEALANNRSNPQSLWTLANDAILSGLQAASDASSRFYADEATWWLIHDVVLLGPQPQPAATDAAVVQRHLDGLHGDHPRIHGKGMELNFHEFQTRLREHTTGVLPRYEAFQTVKRTVLDQTKRQLKTDEFRANVLTSFVRNRLIDEVYLPLIGDNLAKQIGAAGDAKRTDRMGLLLLISPPGYGKTTLMEYVANRLGLVFVKVNGPAIGHAVTSLDPAEATNASAREEVQRINLALEMGDNVMLYLDDIQHCNPELLQKFIPLCDATRKIEGVWQSQSKTYDQRGRKFAVVMAGNPYTESGDLFRVPDMLANRADVYNLGEIIGDAKEAFELSYLENCLTSNPALMPIAKLSSKDQRAIIHSALAGTETLELEASLEGDLLRDATSVLAKLHRVRDVLLQVNRTYIQSAAQVDAYRTEPPFKLQGSYRNMNRIAQRVSPVMNDDELERLILSSYEQDAQTLTRDAESNLLKIKQLLGVLTPREQERWEHICYAYAENVRMGGAKGDDAVVQVTKVLGGVRDGLESVRKTIAKGIEQSTEQAAKPAELPNQKVIVQHSVPRVMLDLVQTQFQLLNDGFKPLLEMTSKNVTANERMEQSVQKLLHAYLAMQQELEQRNNIKDE